jgi:MoxR-like ATPase
MKIKLKQKQKKFPVEAIKTAAGKLAAIKKQLNEMFIDKATEIDALVLCLLTREHLLLDGKHGTAKSAIADAMFSRLTDAKIFSIQLMKGTQVDEVLGPLDAKKYHASAEWYRNTEGYLPSVDFAFLDEVYRAPDMLLPAMMRIVNERKYHNGIQTIKCPLKTAVGTCNFVTENPELEAVHDRWLVKVKVEALKSSSSRLKMLAHEYEKRKTAAVEPITISLDELIVLQQFIDHIEVSADTRSLYEETVADYRKKKGAGHYISDRRLCLAMRLAQAEYLFSDTEAAVNMAEMPLDYVIATKFGIVKVGDESDQNMFGEAHEQIVGNYKRMQEENENLALFEKAAYNAKMKFDPNAPRKEIAKLADNVSKAICALDKIPPTKQPTNERNRGRLLEVKKDFRSLALSIIDTGIGVKGVVKDEPIFEDENSASDLNMADDEPS